MFVSDRESFDLDPFRFFGVGLWFRLGMVDGVGVGVGVGVGAGVGVDSIRLYAFSCAGNG